MKTLFYSSYHEIEIFKPENSEQNLRISKVVKFQLSFSNNGTQNTDNILTNWKIIRKMLSSFCRMPRDSSQKSLTGCSCSRLTAQLLFEKITVLGGNFCGIDSQWCVSMNVTSYLVATFDEMSV